MKVITVIFLVSVFSCVVTTISAEECKGPNEEYRECGSPCIVTCDNYTEEFFTCAPVCVVGCFCVAGYVRNANGVCIVPSQCPPKSGEINHPVVEPAYRGTGICTPPTS